MWLNKTSSDVTLLWRTSWRFLRCWLLLLFSSLKLFTFPDYLSLPAALHPGFSDPLRPSPTLSFTLATFRCFTFARLFILKWALRFWAGMFHPLMFFTLHSFPTFFGTFCDSGEGRNILSRILLCACPHRVVPFDWRMDLNYSYCS